MWEMGLGEVGMTDDGRGVDTIGHQDASCLLTCFHKIAAAAESSRLLRHSGWKGEKLLSRDRISAHLEGSSAASMQLGTV